MTQEELIAHNKAYILPISVRSGLSEAFHCLANPQKPPTLGGMLLIQSGEWEFDGDIATRKADGFTISREEIDRTEVWT